MHRSVSSLGHDALVECTVAEMQRQGMTHIRADHIAGFLQPEIIGNFIPDATARFNGSLCIAECESAAGFTQAHTAAQWRAFHNHISHVGGWFIVVAAKTDEAAARTLLQQTIGSAQNILFWTF
jgi:hypothetical protein